MVSVVTNYEIRTGRKMVSVRDAGSGYQALVDYLRSVGCRDDEIRRTGSESVSWRGAVYRATRQAGLGTP
jgi:hypothetical protein